MATLFRGFPSFSIDPSKSQYGSDSRKSATFGFAIVRLESLVMAVPCGSLLMALSLSKLSEPLMTSFNTMTRPRVPHLTLITLNAAKKVLGMCYGYPFVRVCTVVAIVWYWLVSTVVRMSYISGCPCTDFLSS